jgi:type III secretion protein HrpB1
VRVGRLDWQAESTSNSHDQINPHDSLRRKTGTTHAHRTRQARLAEPDRKARRFRERSCPVDRTGREHPECRMNAMDTQIAMPGRVVDLKRQLQKSLREFEFADAENAYSELTGQWGLDPDSDEMLPSRVMIGIFDNRLLEMLQMLNGLGEDRAPDLKAICLQMLGDPLVEGIAERVEETSEDPDIRRSMRSLLRARKT